MRDDGPPSGEGFQVGTPSYYRFWGKSARGALPCHLLPYHCLDVAAAGWAFLDLHPTLLQDWADVLGMERESCRLWLAFLLALHDGGKFSRHFQGQAPAVLQSLGVPVPSTHGKVGHVTLGALAFRGVLWPTLAQSFAEQGGEWDVEDWMDYLSCWDGPFAGHHGQPPSPTDRHGVEWRIETAWTTAGIRPDADGLAALVSFAEALQQELGLGMRPLLQPNVDVGIRAVRAASWHLAGFAVLCDWIGSSERWFPFEAEPMPLSAYWARGVRAARAAVLEAGILPVAPTHWSGVASTFPDMASPRPMQRVAAELPVPAGPALHIVEDLTGSGKTEAALLLAHRVISDGRAEGLYFALPTMATANAMHGRVVDVKPRLFAKPQDASLVLAHGGVSPSAGPAPLAAMSEPLASTPGAEPDGRLECSRWLADSRKKTFLAHLGVGTLDQALLGVLPVKHQSLRLFGLTSRVLVVDEVHAYDDYTTQLLESLLAFHARAGGTAILLSATLPQGVRQRFVTAFLKATGERERKRVSSDAFPLITSATPGEVNERPVAASAESAREIRVVFLTTAQQAVDVLRTAKGSGKSACWIRNTVGDALDSFASLQDLDPILFHSRFTQADRRTIEAAVHSRLGRDAPPAARAGATVVATQVVEQSLDIDFDEMVTDLAPIDLLLQRAGRLHRHARAGRGPPVLHVLAPDWSDEPDGGWFSGPFRRAAHVYPAHERLWLTMQVLREEGSIRLPGRSRHLIESVYGESAEGQAPAGLRQVAQKAQEERMRKHTRARVARLRLEDDYSRTSGVWDPEERHSTRDGEASRDVHLATREAGPLRPLMGGRWEESRVGIPAWMLAPSEPPMPAADAKALPDEGRSLLLMVPLEPGEDWAGEGKDEKGRRVRVRYSRRRGLETMEDNQR